MGCHHVCNRRAFGASFLNAICMLCCVSPSPLSFVLALRSTFTEKTQWFCNKIASHRSEHDQFLIPFCFDSIVFFRLASNCVAHRCGALLVTCVNPCKKRYSEAGPLERPQCSTSALPRVDIDSGLHQYPRVFFSKNVKENKALQNVSLEIRAGQTLSIVGESGSGKTTLARCVTKLISSDDGEINFNGKNLNRMSKKELNLIRREIQFIFQDPYASLNPRMPVNYLVTEPLHIHGEIRKKENTEHASRLLNEVKLDDSYLNRYPHELSGGQRQRICIARALALKPKLIVADEPLSALDVTIQSQIIDLLLELQLKFKLSFLVISHDLAVVEKISHHVGVMCKGRLVEFGKTNEVLYDPRHNYTKLLLNSIPKINKDRKAKTIKEVNLLDTDYSKKFEFLKDSTYINVSKDHFYLTD